MKDYYKILGLKETASAEEIHERWIELMQKYHPDHGGEGTRDEEAAKEINEAYQTLKYSSSRMEYDLERLHQRSLKTFSIKKFIFLVSGVTGLTFLFVFCLICFLKPQTPPPLKLKPHSPPPQPEFPTIPPYKPGPHWEVTMPVSKTEKAVKVEEEEKIISQQKRQETKAVIRNREKKTDPSPQIVHESGPSWEATKPGSKAEKAAKVEQREKVISPQKSEEIKAVTRTQEKKPDPSPKTVRSEVLEKERPVSPSKEANLSSPPPDPSTALRTTGQGLPSTRTQAEGLEVHPEPRSSTPPSKAGLRGAKQVKQAKSIESSKPVEAPEPPAKIVDVHPISDQTLSVKALERVPEIKPPLLIATEEEVKRFFTNYIERYNHKDIHGFLSLFSNKAIQNEKDRLEGIRRIYDNFFSQSRIVQYHLDDLRMEIHQNAVKAKARYQIDQISNHEGEKKVWQGRIQWVLVKEEGGLRIASLNYQHEKLP